MKPETQQSNNKVKIILGVVVFLIAALLIANWIVGNILEKKLAKNINKSLEEMEPKLDFDYENLQVNPMLAQASFKEGQVKYNEGPGVINFKWDKSVYQGSYADLFNLISENPAAIQELHKAKTDFNNLEITGELKAPNSFDFMFSFAELNLDFKGKLVREELKQAPEKFLQHNQQLTFTLSEFEMDFPKLFDQILINSNLQKKLLNLSKVDITLDYTADDKVIEVKETVDSSHSSGELAGDIKLLGTDVSNINGMKLDLESKGQFEVTNLKWGRANQTGKYTIDKLYGKSEFEIDRQVNFVDYVEKENMILGESSYEVSLEGLKAQFAGSLKQNLTANPLVRMAGINTSQIMVNNLNLIYQTNKRQIRVEKGKLNSSLVDADLKAELKLNNQYPSLSQINNFKVKLSDFKGNLRRLFEGMESRMGVSLPREGDAIVLEMKGTFDQPQIRGVHY